MGIHWKIKAFENLTVNELYDILRLRSEIFVVEQNCVYLDPDGKDKLALHLYGEFEDDLDEDDLDMFEDNEGGESFEDYGFEENWN